MSFLGSRRHHDAAADDVEAYAAGGQTNPGASHSQGISGIPGEHAEHIKFGEQIKQPTKSSDLGEFEALDRFITTYDHERRSSLASSGRLSEKRKWWKFWKSDKATPGGVEIPTGVLGKPPGSWLETDIHHGITELQVEERRKRFGWNELVSEKENMIAKIFGYFTGPILYGRLRITIALPCVFVEVGSN